MNIAALLFLAAVVTARPQSGGLRQPFGFPSESNIVYDHNGNPVSFTVEEQALFSEDYPVEDHPFEVEHMSFEQPRESPFESSSLVQELPQASIPVRGFFFNHELPSQQPQPSQFPNHPQPTQVAQQPQPPQVPQKPQQPQAPQQPQPSQVPQQPQQPQPPQAPQQPQQPQPQQVLKQIQQPQTEEDSLSQNLFFDSKPKQSFQLTSDSAAYVVRQDRLEPSADGVAGVSYETSNGINVVSRTSLDNDGFNVIQGSYSYISADGVPVHVRYIADRNGFRYTGRGLPVGPEIPPHAQEQIERGKRLHEEAARRRAEQQNSMDIDITPFLRIQKTRAA